MEYKIKINNNPKELEEELGRVLILLNGNIELEKSKMLANLFRNYIDNKSPPLIINLSLYLDFDVLFNKASNIKFCHEEIDNVEENIIIYDCKWGNIWEILIF